MPISFKRIKLPKVKIPKLRRRERVLLAFFLLCLLASLFYRKVYVPRAVLKRGLEQKLEKLHTQRISVEAQFPDLDAEKEKFGQMKERYELLKTQLKTQEARLWDRARIPELLETVAKPQEKEEIDLLWVRLKKQIAAKVAKETATSAQPSKVNEERPDKKEKLEIYPRLYIEVCFYSSFDELIKYINGLEQREGYLKMTDVKMSLSEAKPRTPRTTLTLSTLLGEGTYAPEQEQKVQDVFALAEQMVEREMVEPFSPETKPFKEAPPVGLRLSGIMWKGEEAYAIINDKWYKVGDTVEDKVVVSITEKETVLELEEQRYYLKLQE